MEFKILFKSNENINSKEMDFSFGKGYRNIVIRFNQSYYELTVYEPTRLCQSLSYGIVFGDPNAIIIPELNLNILEKALNILIKEGYFEKINKTNEKKIMDYKEAEF